LNAIPTRAHFRLPSWVLRFALQRRFGLHLSMMTDVMSQNNLPLTPLGIKLGAGKEDFLHWILDWIPPAAHGGVEHLGGSSLLSLDRNLPGR